MGFFSRMRNSGGDTSRIKWVGGGFVLGFAWGTIMWLITGSQGGGAVWIYLSLTMGMIGGGVAGIFGAMNARKRGERVLPPLSKKDRKAAEENRAAAKRALGDDGE